jgi:ketosteroid isomerase-like protein
VWEAWFSADRAALMEILPANFIGIGAGEPEMHTREQTIASAEGFLRAGNRLKDLRLFDDRVQRFGPVAVIYCRFSFTFTDPSGASTTVAGRATEVFLREGNRWIHPGWHLDSGA